MPPYPHRFVRCNFQHRALCPSGRLACDLISSRGRIIDRYLVARIGHVNGRFDLVRVTVSSFREGVRGVNLDVHNIIPLRHTGDVDPLPAELFEIPIGPASGNPLERASVTAALVIVTILDQVRRRTPNDTDYSDQWDCRLLGG